MAQGPAIIGGLSLALSAATAGYQISEAEDAKDRQVAQAKAQQDNADTILAQGKTEQAKAEAEQTLEQAGVDTASAKARQRALAAGALGRSDTILTSPLGVSQSPSAQPKTLLGA